MEYWQNSGHWNLSSFVGNHKILWRWFDLGDDLQRLTLGERWEAEFPFLISNEGLPFKFYPQLTSSIVIDNELSLDQIHSLLCSTPSLLWLKMNNYWYKVTHGSQWEHLIKTKLPLLKNFEFYVRLTLRPFIDAIAESRLNRCIVSFCTPFWTEERRWLVTCNYLDVFEEIEIYTTPIWTDFYHRINPFTAMSPTGGRRYTWTMQAKMILSDRCYFKSCWPENWHIDRSRIT